MNPTELATEVAKEYYHLETPSDLDPLMERIGDSRYVLLGEASHGTHEYYTWRTAISKRLILEKGFSFIAVEGDWPDCNRINRFVKSYPGAEFKAEDVLHDFKRWPTWMWANWEIVALAEWMLLHNSTVLPENRIGFYGLDVYSLWESMEEIVKYLKKEDPKTAELAIRAVNCFEPFEEEGQLYASAVYTMSTSCKKEVVKLLQEVRNKSSHYDGDREAGLNAEINALVAANAEKYYSNMVSFGEDSWNIRDKHMVETLNSLMKFHGPDAKAIIWEHNTHIGDARSSSMRHEGLLNVGQLVREQHDSEGVVLVGFGSYEGSVVAGKGWGATMEKMKVPPAVQDTVEDILHKESPENKLLLFDKPILKERFNKWLGHRAIGVVYRPERERGNYVPTILSSRYDAFLYIDKTQALHPLHHKPDGHLVPDTYPFAF